MALASVVTRLRPRQHSYSAAVEAYSSGDFEFCASSLELDDSIAGAALLARVLLRLGRPQDVIELVDATILKSANLSHLESAELLTHRSTARARLDGRNAEIPVIFSDARVAVYAAASAALEAEFLVRESYAYLMAGDSESALARATNVLEIKEGYREPLYQCPLEHSRARAHDILAFIAARQERYDQQKTHYQQALIECDHARVADSALEANLLSNLATFLIDFGDDGYVRERFDRMPSSEWLAPHRYEVLRALAWSNALRGDNLGAFRDLRDASDIATTIPRKMRAILDRAYFSRQLKQDISAREEVDYAERLSSRVDWNLAASDDGELTALAFLAQEIASTQPVRARRLFDRYKALKPKLPPNFVAANDRRARAEELGVDATIAAAEGCSGRSITLFVEAFEIWDALGYGVRAALVARNLAALGAGEHFAQYAAAQGAQRPRSWLAANVT